MYKKHGWNGKGMFIYTTNGYNIPSSMLRNQARKHFFTELSAPTDGINIYPRIDMKAVDNSIVVGWMASQTDIFADDWIVVE